MPITHRFGPKPGAGFVRAYSAGAARRQLQISLALVLVLGSAAVALGLLTQIDLANAARPAGLGAGGRPAAQMLMGIRSWSSPPLRNDKF